MSNALATETMTSEAVNPLLSAFESETCSRCAGSGQYSYCQMYGTTCFKCRGKGRTYTKRAEVALAWAKEQRTVKAKDVQVGWMLYEDGMFSGKAGWFPVESCEMTENYSTTQDGVKHYYFDIVTSQMSHGNFPDSDVQAIPSREFLKDVRARALEYQSRLTKAGTVRKGDGA